ncbi:cuticle protein 16.8-like [Limulus polyphemus]|uniref:Cuticle protein 16.8-like n=1 Tax=Limulus polyphemus TaxID=6850 RepID=A0ABM1SJK9_LIMPO|nr:cuticle protein 16.8-like [Limulus polyphemus]
MMKVVCLCFFLGYAAAQYAPTHGYPAPAHGYPAPVHGKAGYAPEPYYKPFPYNFGYEIENDYGDRQWQREQGDEYGNKQGSYGYVDAYGINRQVEYVADEYGFRANIKTNEPGTHSQNPAHVSVYSDPVPVKHNVPANGHGHPAPYGVAPGYGPAVPQVHGYAPVEARHPGHY